MRKYLCISFYYCIFASEKETNNKLNPKTRKGTEIMKRSSIIYNKEYITKHSNQALNLMWELMARCVYRYGSRLIIEFPKEGDYIPSYTMDFCPTDGSGKFLKDDEYVCVVYDDATGEEIACFVDYMYACRWLTDLVTNNDFYAIYNFDTEDSKK